MDLNEKVDIKGKKNKYSISLKIEILDLFHKGVSLHEIEKNIKSQELLSENGKVLKKN